MNLALSATQSPLLAATCPFEQKKGVPSRKLVSLEACALSGGVRGSQQAGREPSPPLEMARVESTLENEGIKPLLCPILGFRREVRVVNCHLANGF